VAYPLLGADVNPYPCSYSTGGGSGSNYGTPTSSTFCNDTPSANDFEPVVDDVACGWMPDIATWSIDYATEGLTNVTQSWIVQNNSYLPIAIRQMLSWNRDKYGRFSAFYDNGAGLGRKRAPRNLVPVSVKLTPLANDFGGYFLDQHWTSMAVASGQTVCSGNGGVNLCAFPTVVTDKWRMDISWSLDEFRNRLNIQYAKVEIEPSVRLESLQGSNLGVVPLNATGGPDINADIKKINSVSTGFPVREPQLLIKITYPWVRLKGAWPSIEQAGPIGIWSGGTAPGLGVVPTGMLLGCVNDSTFLGFPEGRVLYSAADMVEKVSPVSGRLGYQITHVFNVLPTVSWNMSRYAGDLKDIQPPGEGLWPYGYMVALGKDRKVYQANNKAIYPYREADLRKLLYYNDPATGSPVVPNDEG
jgi:hypothetical protein